MNLTKTKEAFTLIEIMVVMVMIAVIASLAIPGIMNKMEKMNINATKTTMSSVFKAALMDYREDVGHFPTAEEGG